MKESGYLWLGDIPCDWDTKRIKYIAKLKGRIGWQGLTSDEYQDDGAYLITGTDFVDGEINWESCEHIPYKRWEEATEIQIEEGDLLITKDGTVGKVAIVNNVTEKTSLNSGVLRIIPNDENDRKFLFWVLRSDVFWNWFNYKNAGNSTILHLYQNDFYEFVYAFPKLNEQKIIANFLDERCMKIDDAIADLEKQLKILTDYKTALINECVTRGCSEIKLKDSGIKCIGKINSRWDVKRLKYLLATPLQYGANEAGDDYDERNPRYIRITDISENNFLKDDGKQSLEYSLAKPYLLNNGDVLFARSGATVGKTFYYTKDCGVAAFAGYLIRATTKSSILYSKFLYYITLSSYYESWKNTSFSMATIQNIGADKYNDLPIVLPKLKEQIKIVDYLDEKVTLINEIIDKKQLQLEKIKSNKSSLIYEYVTGKKRVKVGE